MNLIEFKPQLAIDINKVKTLPNELMCSAKYDGIRTTFFSGIAYSRSLKLIPNLYIQAFAKKHADVLHGLDCELIIGNPFAKDVFSQSTSGCMRIQGEPEFTIYAFDLYLPSTPFKERYKLLSDLVLRSGVPNLVLVVHTPLEASEISTHEAAALAQGAEGLMLRDANAQYKCGRSGTRNPELMKVKSFTDEEFLIVGYEPKYHNANEPKKNELGRTARSTSKDGMIALDTLGAFVLQTKDNRQFNVGSGFTEEMRKNLWDIRGSLIGKWCKIKHFLIGQVDVPRLPIFLGIRDEIDM
jgi:DNA ligase-1